MMGRYHLSDDAHPEDLMRPVSFLLAAAIMLAACDTATAPRSMQSSVDDSRVPAELRALYREDAARLALRELQARPGGYGDIAISAELIDPYYAALVQVFNADGLGARDTVVDVYSIHTFGQPETRRLLLQASADQEWVQRLVNGELPTGNAPVDSLLEDYGLSLDWKYPLSTSNEMLIVLRAADALNVAALAHLFDGVAGLRYSEPDGMAGDGNDIRALRGALILLDYSVGYGDCPAGCIARRTYHFAVHADGTVEYLGASGSPPPNLPQP